MLKHFEYSNQLVKLIIRINQLKFTAMLTTIHTITDNIIIRKSFKWKNNLFFNKDLLNINDLYTRIERILEKYLNKVALSDKKCSNICKYITNIYSVKSRLDETPWNIPGNLNDDENKIFLQDLDFYLMISGVLLKANHLFKGFIDKCKHLSILQMLPTFNSHPKRIKETLSQLQESKWLYQIMHQREKSPYINEINELENNISSSKMTQELATPIQNILNTFNTPLANQEEEEYKTITLKSINQQYKQLSRLDSKLTTKTWSVLKQMLIDTLIVTPKSSLTQDYINCIDSLKSKDAININRELKDIKYQMKSLSKFAKKNKHYTPETLKQLHIIYDKITEYQKEIKEVSSSGKFIEWTQNPKEFVKKIQALISNGCISIKGNSDTVPIVEIITKFVKVRKLNNSGMLSPNSLLTYFKKANTGEL